MGLASLSLGALHCLGTCCKGRDGSGLPAVGLPPSKQVTVACVYPPEPSPYFLLRGCADASSYFAGQQAAFDVRELEDFAHEHQDQVSALGRNPPAHLRFDPVDMLICEHGCCVSDGS